MTRFRWILIVFLAIFLFFPTADLWAQSSLGIGRSEQTVPTGGLFAGFFNWIRIQQTAFHSEMRQILVTMRQEGSGMWLLATLCFLYGVFHAIGPGHGKVVISSYMLANEVALWRGVGISLAASFMQGFTAIAAIGAFLVALRGTGIKSGDLTYILEIASYIGVMLVGLWLLWGKIFRRTRTHSHAHDHSHVGGGETCDHCGHSHAPDPEALSGAFGLREAWAAILAVGLRPCTGALIVLVFCFANDLFNAGVTATLAMSLGTGLSVSLLAVLAVTAKNTALRLAGFQDRTKGIQSAIEITGAVLIFLFGLILFTAAFSG